MIYKPAKGSILADKQAQQYGECIAAVIKGNDGTITPDDVLDNAKAVTSPLHDFFDWDDAQAAYKYRLEQAGYLLRSIHIVVKQNGEEETIRAFHNGFVTTDETQPERVYVSIQRVLSETDLRRQVIEQALRQLASWQKKYRQYCDDELARIFGAIEETRKEIIE